MAELLRLLLSTNQTAVLSPISDTAFVSQTAYYEDLRNCVSLRDDIAVRLTRAPNGELSAFPTKIVSVRGLHGSGYRSCVIGDALEKRDEVVAVQLVGGIALLLAEVPAGWLRAKRRRTIPTVPGRVASSR